MKVTKDQAAANKEAILTAASRLYREKGIDGIGIGELSRSVGLTHGGFGTYFDSKEDLVAQACEATVKRQSERIARAVATGDFTAELLGLFDRYLSQDKRDNPDQACLFPCLAGDMSRQPETVRSIFTAGLKDYMAGLQALLGGDEAEAMTVMSTLVGAMILARAIDDREVSDRLLESVQTRLAEAKGGKRSTDFGDFFSAISSQASEKAV